MSPFYGEYATLDEVRKVGGGAQLDIQSNSYDAFLLSLIREVSQGIDEMCNRKFAPYVATQFYDTPSTGPWAASNLYLTGGRAGDVFQSRTGGYSYGRSLRIDNDDLLEVNALTNGDGTSITAASYNLYPANTYPKNELRLRQSSSYSWQPDSNGNYEQVITLTAVFGYHQDYNGAWGGGGSVADAAGIATTTATTYLMSAAGAVKAGQLLKMDSEYLYCSAVAGTTATIERGVNGTTAAVHTLATAVSYWKPTFTVSKITRMGTAALWNLRANPEGKQVSINGVTFTTPNSIMQWAENELELAGLQRTGLG